MPARSSIALIARIVCRRRLRSAWCPPSSRSSATVVFPLDQPEQFPSVFGPFRAFWDPFTRYDGGWYYQNRQKRLPLRCRRTVGGRRQTGQARVLPHVSDPDAVGGAPVRDLAGAMYLRRHPRLVACIRPGDGPPVQPAMLDAGRRSGLSIPSLAGDLSLAAVRCVYT